MSNPITSDKWSKLRRTFVESDITMRQLARQAPAVIGAEVTYEAIRKQANLDGWTKDKERHSAQATNISAEVDGIRQLLYDYILSSGQEGLFVFGDDLDRLKQQIIELPGVEKVQLTKSKVDINAVRVYMDLLNKSGANIQLTNTTGKTSREQVIELTQKALTNRGPNHRSRAGSSRSDPAVPD